MAKIITRTKNTIKANCFLPGKARDAFDTLVTDHNGKIDIITTDFGDRKVATFEDIETATRIADKLNAQYASVGWKPVLDCDRKPANAKGDAPKLTLDDFIRANPLCTREEAKKHGFEGTRADLRARKEKLGVR